MKTNFFSSIYIFYYQKFIRFYTYLLSSSICKEYFLGIVRDLSCLHLQYYFQFLFQFSFSFVFVQIFHNLLYYFTLILASDLIFFSVNIKEIIGYQVLSFSPHWLETCLCNFAFLTPFHFLFSLGLQICCHSPPSLHC